MKDRLLAMIAAVAVAIVLLAAQVFVADYRTPWGDPDLQGVWTATTPTPLERPLQGAKVINTDEEAEALEAELARKWQETRGGGNDPNNPTGSYNAFWQDRGRPIKGRTSLIVDPADGRLPPMTPQGQAIRDAQPQGGVAGPADGPEDRNEGERCLHWERFIGGVVNQHYRIVQSPGFIGMNMERLHDNRVIRMGRPHLPQDVRQWNGDSVGHVEGDTIVVDTTNFNEVKGNRLGMSKNVHIIERFTRVDQNTIRYRATVDDPSMWTKAWTIELPLTREPEGTLGIYEYACHEGNYGMLGILRGYRAQEQKK